MKAFLALWACIACVAAGAQTYPSKPVRIVVPAAAGGGLDLITRAFSGRLAELWGQQVLVENRPGANFIVGTEAVAKAAPDGYTLLLTSSGALTINPAVYPSLPYDPLRDLVAITFTSSNPFVVLVNNEVPVKSLQELVAHLRANPGKLNHASNSATTILASELFKQLAGVQYADINYKGGVLAAASTAAGETHFCIVDMGSATAPVRAGRLRALAVTTAQRYKLQPDIPTVAESGVPGYSSAAWAVLAAPAKTAPDIIKRINEDLARVLALPEVRARIEALGSEVIANAPADAQSELRADLEKWTKLVRERNLKLQ